MKILSLSGLEHVYTKLKSKFVQQETGKGLSTNDYTDAEKAKVTGAEQTSNKVTAVTSSSTDTQYPTAKLLYDNLELKVDKITGKQLSTEDYTTAEKTKLSGIEESADKTVVDDVTINKDSNGKIQVKDGGISQSKTDADFFKDVSLTGTTQVDALNVVTKLCVPDNPTAGNHAAGKGYVDNVILTKVAHYSEMPEAHAGYLGEIVQYTGTSTSDYINGYFYKGIQQSGSYSWENISVQKERYTCYGFHINGNESSPANMVTYLRDAVGKTPAYMDFTNDVFNWGSWEDDDFFMPRPCMLKYDGTVDYYLDPDDYTKKADGSASDVANSAYAGNAMMEWGRDGRKIWTKVVPDTNDSNSASIYISDGQLDDDYHAYAFINENGDLAEHFYTSIYNGSLISSKLRSISGQTVMQSQTVSAEITYAKANGQGWNTEVFGDIVLINYLLILISKTTNSQLAFGYGRCGYSGSSNMAATGLMNDKGLFWGQSAHDGTETGVKVFGMEHWYGNQWRRFAGFICDNGNIKYKLCYGQSDGSTVDDYNLDGTGYISSGITLSGSSSGYISKEVFNKNGSMLPSVASGSDSTYYADRILYTDGMLIYALRGGPVYENLGAGNFCTYLRQGTTRYYISQDVAATLSYKPLIS